VVLKIFCDYDQRVGVLEVIEADRPIMVGDESVRTTAQLKDGDTIRIDVGQICAATFRNESSRKSAISFGLWT